MEERRTHAGGTVGFRSELRGLGLVRCRRRQPVPSGELNTGWCPAVRTADRGLGALEPPSASRAAELKNSRELRDSVLDHLDANNRSTPTRTNPGYRTILVVADINLDRCGAIIEVWGKIRALLGRAKHGWHFSPTRLLSIVLSDSTSDIFLTFSYFETSRESRRQR